jgi:hypothetical protein
MSEITDKRKVSTDALETLGTIIDGDAGRDAIHLAVEPVMAGEDLYPGENIGLIDGKARSGVSKLLGIVDPFLKEKVKEGQLFWLIVYPRQITSLRHVWSHPDFPEETATASRITKAKKWIEEFAALIGIDYLTLIQGATEYAERGEYLHMGDNEEYGNHYDKMEEFWDNYEIVTGKSVTNKNGFFTCSC